MPGVGVATAVAGVPQDAVRFRLPYIYYINRWRETYTDVEMPGVGIEPTWDFSRLILSQLRLPDYATRANTQYKRYGSRKQG